MFGMSLGEVFFIFVIAIIVLGPDKLPSAIKSIARLFNQVKSQTGELQDALHGLQQDANEIGQSVNKQLTSIDGLNDLGDFDDFAKQDKTKKTDKSNKKDKAKSKDKKDSKAKTNTKKVKNAI